MSPDSTPGVAQTPTTPQKWGRRGNRVFFDAPWATRAGKKVRLDTTAAASDGITITREGKLLRIED